MAQAKKRVIRGEKVESDDRIPPMVGTEIVAKRFNIHPRTVRRNINRGCPAYRVGKDFRFVLAEVMAWMRARAVGGGAVGGRVRVQAHGGKCGMGNAECGGKQPKAGKGGKTAPKAGKRGRQKVAVGCVRGGHG